MSRCNWLTGHNVYFIDHFIDKEQGGAYWSLLADGTPKNTDKQTYGIAFAIYGLSEHFRATQNRESLDQLSDSTDVWKLMLSTRNMAAISNRFTRDWQSRKGYGYDGAGWLSRR